MLHAAGANSSHGLRRTHADKRRCVLALLADPEWAAWSDRELARRCGVHHELVGRLRREVSGGNRQMARQVERGGRTYVLHLNEESRTTTPVREPPAVPSAADDQAPGPDFHAVVAGDWWRAGLHTLFVGPSTDPRFQERLPSCDLALIALPTGDEATAGSPEAAGDPEAAGAELGWLRRHTGVVALLPTLSLDQSRLETVLRYGTTEVLAVVLIPQLEDATPLLAADAADRVLIAAVPDPNVCARVLHQWETETGASAERGCPPVPPQAGS